MQSLPYSALNDDQRARVDYLFADAVFGTDPHTYMYVWDGQDIKGRTSTTKTRHITTRARDLAPAKVTMRQEVNVTDKLIQTANTNMDALAALIANRIQQSQLEEVHA